MLRILMAGASGLIGTALSAELEKRGDEVYRLVRREPAGARELRWDPAAGQIDAEQLGGFDAAVSLSGAVIGGKRWTEARKREIVSSRVDTTDLMVSGLLASGSPPPVIVVSSAIGIYGNRGDETLDEGSPPGDPGEFLVEVVEAWEKAGTAAEEAGLRVPRLRTAPVYTADGGILPRMLLPFRAGIGGRIGSGNQWWSWIAFEDAIAAYLWSIDGDADGPVVVSSPNPVTNADLTRTIGRVLGRPTFMVPPRFALDAMLGRDQVEEILYSSTRVVPTRLLESGFEFAHPDLEPALRHILGK